MNSASQDVGQFLVDKGIGLFGGQSAFAIYVNNEPPEPDDVITLYDTSSPPPARAMNTTSVFTKFTNFQIRTRGNDQKVTYAKLDTIIKTINNISAWIIINSTRYMNFQPVTDILSLPQDDNERWIFVINYQTIRN